MEQEDEKLMELLAEKLVNNKLGSLAVFFLEASRPVSFIGSQTMIFLGPLVQALFPIKNYDRFATLMEDRKNINRLIRVIESKQEEKKR